MTNHPGGNFAARVLLTIMARSKRRILVDELLIELQRINELAAAKADFAKTLVLLRALKAGTVGLENVTVTADGWQVAQLLARAVAAVEEASQASETESPVSP
jgi:hypothetical protein